MLRLIECQYQCQCIGFYECSCAAGYLLDPLDRRSCSAQDTSHVFLLALQANELKELRLYRLQPQVARGVLLLCTLLT